MKIIGTSNFDNESTSDVLICENINKWFGEKFVKILVNEMNEYSSTYYKLVEDDYELYEFQP